MDKNIKSLVCRTANQLVKEGYSRSCAFKTAWFTVKSDMPFNSPIEDNKNATDLSQQVHEYKKIQKAIETLEAQANAIKEALIAEMEAQNTQELKVDIFKIRYITVVSNRFDTTAFKKAHTDLYSEYLKESTYKRFNVL